MPEVLGILSCSANGYVRERAVHLLVNFSDGCELPFLLVRLNDWVEQVRTVASDAVLERITPAYAAHFVRCLPLIDRLERQARPNQPGILDAITTLLSAAGCRSALRAGLQSPDRLTRRLALRRLTSAGAEDSLQLLKEGLASEDLAIRLWSARELRRRLSGNDLQETLVGLVRDRSLPLRREGLYGFAEQLPEHASSYLMDSLFDPSPSIREVARFYLHKQGTTDFASIYRSALMDGRPTLIGIVAGLGETGTKQDLKTLSSYLEDPSAEVRRGAVRGLGRIGADHCVHELRKALLDPTPRVVRAAGNVFQANLHLLSPDDLRALLQNARLPHQLEALLSLIAGLSWWDGAAMLLAATGLGDEPLRAHALEYLRRWSHDAERLCRRPTPIQVRKLEEAIRLYGAEIEQTVRRDAISLLSYAKKEYLGQRA